MFGKIVSLQILADGCYMARAAVDTPARKVSLESLRKDEGLLSIQLGMPVSICVQNAGDNVVSDIAWRPVIPAELTATPSSPYASAFSMSGLSASCKAWL